MVGSRCTILLEEGFDFRERVLGLGMSEGDGKYRQVKSAILITRGKESVERGRREGRNASTHPSVLGLESVVREREFECFGKLGESKGAEIYYQYMRFEIQPVVALGERRKEEGSNEVELAPSSPCREEVAPNPRALPMLQSNPARLRILYKEKGLTAWASRAPDVLEAFEGRRRGGGAGGS